jgi:hypothetical protein
MGGNNEDGRWEVEHIVEGGRRGRWKEEVEPVANRLEYASDEGSLEGFGKSGPAGCVGSMCL